MCEQFMNKQPKPPRIGVAVNPEKEGAFPIRDALMARAGAYGIECLPVSDAAALTPEGGLCALVVIGGDGSILRFAAAASALALPLLGVNLGRVGFLSEIMPGELDAALARLARGDYRVETRMMLVCRVNGGEAVHCLNDVLVFKHQFSGTAEVDVAVGGKRVGKLFCDGIIAATPTGSTAYSLSAGGPVVAPGLDAMLITPVCSHTLHLRPIVAAPDAEAVFTIRGPGMVAADGERVQALSAGDRVTITRSPRVARFIRFGEENVFDLIHEKLS